jgi:hypothetical protein
MIGPFLRRRGNIGIRLLWLGPSGLDSPLSSEGVVRWPCRGRFLPIVPLGMPHADSAMSPGELHGVVHCWRVSGPMADIAKSTRLTPSRTSAQASSSLERATEKGTAEAGQVACRGRKALRVAMAMLRAMISIGKPA